MKFSLIILLGVICSTKLLAQITGNDYVLPGAVEVYTYNDGIVNNHRHWVITYGTLVSDTVFTDDTYQLTVQWDALCSEVGKVEFKLVNTLIDDLDVHINAPAPATPTGTLTVDQECRSTIITRTASPPSAVVTWYWQFGVDGDEGEDITYDDASYELPESGWVHLRAYSCGQWSEETISTHTAVIDPGAPSTTDASQCGAGSINITATPGSQGDNVKWYDVASGGSPVHTGTSYSVSPDPGNSVTYYAVSYDSDTECEGTTRVATIATTQVKPNVTFSPGNVFTGQRVTIPSSDTPFSTITWTASATGVTGSSGGSEIQGAGTTTPLSLQTLTLSGSTEGTVAYSVTPSLNGCDGETRTATVNVYKYPGIATTTNYVSKDAPAILSLAGSATYNEYRWMSLANTLLSTSSTYSATLAGGYKVNVTRNGATATTETVTILNQLDDLNMNYVITRVAQVENLSTTADKTEYEVAESIQYVDGLGRPVQTVGTKNSPLHKDMVQAIDFDEYGREAVKYLPYSATDANGRYKATALKDGTYANSRQAQFYDSNSGIVPDDAAPYAVTVFENSPLNRVVEQGSPGTAWQPGTDHTITKQYRLNLASEVLSFSYNATTNEISLAAAPSSADAHYPKNRLTVTKTFDEEQNDVIEYVDKEGHTICKKVKAATGVYACTYYIYDDFGNLVVVLPPEAINKILNP